MLSSLPASLCLRSHQWLYQTAHRQCKPWRRAKSAIYQRNTPSNWVAIFCRAAASKCRLWGCCTKRQQPPLLTRPRVDAHVKDEFWTLKSSQKHWWVWDSKAESPPQGRSGAPGQELSVRLRSDVLRPFTAITYLGQVAVVQISEQLVPVAYAKYWNTEDGEPVIQLQGRLLTCVYTAPHTHRTFLPPWTRALSP